jgi:hypothetical protein
MTKLTPKKNEENQFSAGCQWTSSLKCDAKQKFKRRSILKTYNTGFRIVKNNYEMSCLYGNYFVFLYCNEIS